MSPKFGVGSNGLLGNAIVDLYAMCDNMEMSLLLFCWIVFLIFIKFGGDGEAIGKW